MQDTDDLLLQLEEWYSKHCDGDWEHSERIKLNTIDNPGWYLTINLEETELEGKYVRNTEIERGDKDWINYFTKNGKFVIAGGPKNLREMLSIFLTWAKTETPKAK
jgi:hypothetical protein